MTDVPNSSEAVNNKHTKKKRKSDLKPEVLDAVNDILHGTKVDSGIEWLQREYMKLMKREARLISEYGPEHEKIK